MLERAARGWEPAPAVGLGRCLWATTRRKDVRGAANLCRGLRVVGRGEPIFPREHRRSAPRAITVPNELTNGCLRGGREPPNGSRLSCGRQARGPTSTRPVDAVGRRAKSNSTLLGGARQLQAQVRQRAPRDTGGR